MERVEIFKTNVRDQQEADLVTNLLLGNLSGSRINFDLTDREKILRIENLNIPTEKITALLEGAGFFCKLIPDRVCDALEESVQHMHDFWESGFVNNQMMWGSAPANSAKQASHIFLQGGVKDVLIPGFGYGRNASVFLNSGMRITGIEISETAIKIAEQHFSAEVRIIHGSVTHMPFDENLYEGIFCYGLLYLLKGEQRKKMVADCYNQLKPGGTMIFSVIAKKSHNYGKGREVAKDTFEIGKGGQLFFYDAAAVEGEFEAYGLRSYVEIAEPGSTSSHAPAFTFFFVECRKD